MRQIGVKNIKLSEYEMSIAAHLVDPLSMQVLSTVSQSGGRTPDSQHEGGARHVGSHGLVCVWLQITWADIAGLDEVITELKETVILPVQKRHLFQNSRLLQPPKGQPPPWHATGPLGGGMF